LRICANLSRGCLLLVLSEQLLAVFNKAIRTTTVDQPGRRETSREQSNGKDSNCIGMIVACFGTAVRQPAPAVRRRSREARSGLIRKGIWRPPHGGVVSRGAGCDRLWLYAAESREAMDVVGAAVASAGCWSSVPLAGPLPVWRTVFACSGWFRCSARFCHRRVGTIPAAAPRLSAELSLRSALVRR